MTYKDLEYPASYKYLPSKLREKQNKLILPYAKKECENE